MKIILFILSAFFILNILGEDSTLESISLDDNSTYIIQADIDLNGWYYYIDKTACICWLGSSSGSNPMINVSCVKLIEHAALTPYVAHCKE
jgi:hypothetical protein